MTVVTRRLGRGRAPLLATSMLATSVLAGFGGLASGVLLAPGAAAAQTCTDPATVTPGDPPTTTSIPGSPVTVDCGPGDFTGVGFQSTGPTGADLTLNIAGPGTVSGGGVLLNDDGNQANLTVVLGNATAVGPTINSTGTGVAVISSGGSVVITDGNLALGGETISGAGIGILASNTGNGNATVAVGGNVSGGRADGVHVVTDAGSNTVTVGGSATGSGVGANGVVAFAEGITGNNTVTVGGNATGNGGNGVVATTTIGSNTVTVGGNATGISNDGVEASTLIGNDTVMVGGNATGGVDGASASTDTGNNAVTVSGNATGAADGVSATTGIGNNTATVGGSAAGASTDGVLASTGAGTNTVTVGGDATGGADGVFATASTGNNTVTVGGNASGVGGDGVNALTQTGNNAVTVGGNAIGNATNGDGVTAQIVGAGDNAVTVGGNATGGSDGVAAETPAGNNTVTVGGNAVGGNAGVSATTSAGDNTVTVANASGGFAGVFAGATAGKNTVAVSGDATGGEAGVFATTTAGDNAVTVANASGGTFGVGAETTTGNNTVTTSGDVSGGSFGVFADTTGDEGPNPGSGSGDNTVTTSGAVSGGTTGVFAAAATGNNTVTTNGNVSGLFSGIEAETTIGGNTVTTSGNVSGVEVGVSAETVTGSNTVTTSGNVAAGSEGVFADAGIGNSLVTVAGNVTVNGKSDDNGIVALSGSGVASVTLAANANITVSALANASGIDVSAHGGNGAVTLGDGAEIGVGGANASGNFDGVQLRTFGGNATVSGGDGELITVTGNASLIGVLALASGANEAATVTFGNQTTGSGIAVNALTINSTTLGVLAQAVDGAAAVTIGTTPVTVTHGTGIEAFGGVSATVTTAGLVADLNTVSGLGVIADSTGGPAAVDIETGGAVEVSGNVASGVVAMGAGNASVTLGDPGAGGGIVVTGNATGTASIGVEAQAGGNATVASGAMPITVVGGVGIDATGAAVSVTTGGDVNATGFGIETESGGATLIDVVGGAIKAGNATTPAIGFTQNLGDTTATVAIGPGATVQNSVGGASGLAIAAFSQAGNSTGSVVVTDFGTLIGDVNFGMLAPSKGNVSDVTVNVASGGLWTTSGLDVFGLGNVTTTDMLNISGTVQTTAPTTFQFGNSRATGASNQININGGDLAVGSTLTIADPSVTLTNAGTIDLLGTPAGSIQLNGPTTNFVGVAGGVIETTANLAAPGSPANTLNVATTSGVNGIVVEDGAPTSAPAHVTTADPIVLVTATGANAATFTLTGGTGFATFGPNAAGLIKGPWLYTLENNVPFGGTNDTVLVSQPGPAAFEAPVLVTAAQDIWYATAPWQDRQADLRDSSLLAPGSVGSFTPGVWIKAVGDWTDRTDSIDAGRGFAFNLGYHQDTYGLVGGVDVANKWANGVGLIGVGVGYLNSNVDFDSHMGNVSDGRFEGWTASVYATYIEDQFFIDGQVKGDFLQLHVTGLPGSNDWTSWGGQVESGYRFPLGGSVMLEPVGTLAYVSTDVGDANVAGTIFHYGTEDSLRGALGLRLSAPLMSNDSYMVKLAVDGRVWDEFDGTNKVTLISAGTPVEVEDNFTGAFGEVGGALDIYSHDGHSSGFVTLSYKFKSDYDEGKVAVGYRYQWGAPPPPPPPPAPPKP